MQAARQPNATGAQHDAAGIPVRNLTATHHRHRCARNRRRPAFTADRQPVRPRPGTTYERQVTDRLASGKCWIRAPDAAAGSGRRVTDWYHGES